MLGVREALGLLAKAVNRSENGKVCRLGQAGATVSQSRASHGPVHEPTCTSDEE